jgi:hypothetical protein
MQFNDTTNNAGICQDVWNLTGTDSTSLTTSTIARIANKVIRELALLAWQVSTNWKFDDSNQSTHSIATISLVDNQEDYALPTTVFDIERAEIIDVNGNATKLIFLPEKNVDIAISELYKTKGKPVYYILRGQSIFLKPAPNTNMVSSLKLYLSRDISEFSASDTTKEPGFPSILHPIIPIMISLEVAGINGLPQLNYIKMKADEWRAYFVDYFTARGQENKLNLMPKINNYE